MRSDVETSVQAKGRKLPFEVRIEQGTPAPSHQLPSSTARVKQLRHRSMTASANPNSKRTQVDHNNRTEYEWQSPVGRALTVTSRMADGRISNIDNTCKDGEFLTDRSLKPHPIEPLRQRVAEKRLDVELISAHPTQRRMGCARGERGRTKDEVGLGKAHSRQTERGNGWTWSVRVALANFAS